jgi:hypothetical protein
MNKRAVIGFCFILMTFLIGFVSAVDVEGTTRDVQDFFTPLLKVLFGQETGLFELLLFGLIIVAATYMALSRISFFKSSSFVLWTITIVTALLSVRYIGSIDAIEALLFPQGVYGIALLTILPLFLFFWFVEAGLEGSENRIIRKLCWIIYAAVFTFLWVKQFYIPGKMETLDNWGYMYLIAAGIAIVFLLLDGTIQGAIASSHSHSHLERIKSRELSKIRKQMEKAQEELEGPTLENEMNILKDKLERVLKWKV